MELYSRKKSLELYERAQKVIPNGIWGHNAWPVTYENSRYPLFATKGKGAYFWDVDGNRYIDYMCGFGSMINGYANEEIAEAVKSRIDKGDGFNIPTETSIALAESLVGVLEGMSWAVFSKNGSDSTSVAYVIARALTGKNTILGERGSFHGSSLWNNWSHPPEGRGNSHDVRLFDWNDVESVRRVFTDNRDEVAAIILTPFYHPIPGESRMPSPEFLAAIRELCDETGALFILDDIRGFYRLHEKGSHVRFGFEPDLICISKALGNTYSIAATVGTEKSREAAQSILYTGTFWNCSADMTAALKNIEILKRTDCLGYMEQLGKMFVEGMVAIGTKHGFPLTHSGPLTFPNFHIKNDDDYAKMKVFANLMAERGVFIHPTHHMYLSAAHKKADIEETLAIANQSFEALSGLL